MFGLIGRISDKTMKILEHSKTDQESNLPTDIEETLDRGHDRSENDSSPLVLYTHGNAKKNKLFNDFIEQERLFFEDYETPTARVDEHEMFPWSPSEGETTDAFDEENSEEAETETETETEKGNENENAPVPCTKGNDESLLNTLVRKSKVGLHKHKRKVRRSHKVKMKFSDIVKTR